MDQQIGGGPTQRHRPVEGLALEQNAVAIDPAILDVLHIVVHHEAVYRREQLEIAQIRKEVGLHHGQPHT